jgi:hypothetical protein
VRLCFCLLDGDVWVWVGTLCLGLVRSHVGVSPFPRPPNATAPLHQIEGQLECSLCSYHPNGTARAFMADYKSRAVASLQRFLADGDDRVVWAPACFKHCENLCMAHTESPAIIGGKSYAAALGAWFFNGSGAGEAYIQDCPPGDLICTPVCGSGCECAPGSPGGTADPPTPPN